MSTSREDFGIAVRSALLQRGAKQKFSLFFLISISLIIFFLDYYNFKVISVTKSLIKDGLYRISNVATAPLKIFEITKNQSSKLIFSYKENESLKKELEVLKQKEFQVEYLKNQNDSLRKILDSSKKISEENTLAKVLLDKDSPFLKSIIINRGSKTGITKGMPVVDGSYLVGKIVEVNYLSSRVLLLNDLNSRIPVTLGQNNIQAILIGKGEKKPTLDYLPELFSPQDDETVFTSGKGGIFAPGIPIGKTMVEKDKLKVKLFSDPNQLSFVTVQLVEIDQEKF